MVAASLAALPCFIARDIHVPRNPLDDYVALDPKEHSSDLVSLLRLADVAASASGADVMVAIESRPMT